MHTFVSLVNLHFQTLWFKFILRKISRLFSVLIFFVGNCLHDGASTRQSTIKRTTYVPTTCNPFTVKIKFKRIVIMAANRLGGGPQSSLRSLKLQNTWCPPPSPPASTAAMASGCRFNHCGGGYRRYYRWRGFPPTILTRIVLYIYKVFSFSMLFLAMKFF